MMGGVVDVAEGLGNWGFKISRVVETGGVSDGVEIEGWKELKDRGGDELS